MEKTASRILNKKFVLLHIAFLVALSTRAQDPVAKNVKLIEVAKGWSANSINTVIFRKNSLTSYKNVQFISYYDEQGFVVIGKRKLNEKKWQLKTTDYKGDISDAHKSISIAIDGNGFLHMAWDQHNNQ